MEPKEINEDEKEILIDYYVQKVSGRLRQLVSPNDNDKKRWVWELLQNAKDSVSTSGRKVDVRIEVTNEYVIFKHNGDPFTPKALNSLIWQKSGDKRGHVESTGRFGTGFLTTHTLSHDVQLTTGVIESSGDQWAVSLTLHRGGELDDDLKDGIQKTLASRKWESAINEWTTFKYLLKNDSNKESAAAGVLSLKKAIFYNLCFTEQINSVTLLEGGKESIYQRDGNPSTYGQITETSFVTNLPGLGKLKILSASFNEPNEQLTTKFQKDRNLNVEIAIAVNGLTNAVIPIEKEVPFLFCLFPLIGTEEFTFPVIINSRDFEPTPERDSLILLGEDTISETGNISNTGINKMILRKAVDLYLELLQHISRTDIMDTYLLAKSDVPKIIQDDWFKDEIQSRIRKEILNTKLVLPAIGKEKIKPSETVFPIFKKDRFSEFWRLCSVIIGDKIPIEKDSDLWQSIIRADSADWNGLQLKFELEDLLRLIESEGNLKQFASAYFDSDESQALNYIKNVIRFVEKEDMELFIRKEAPLKIFPNQTSKGDFAAKEDLYRDGGIPDELKDVIELVDKDWREFLLRKELNEVFDRKVERNVKDVSDQVKDCIEKYYSNKLKDEEKAKVEKGLFALIKVAQTPILSTQTQLFDFVKTLNQEQSFTEIRSLTGLEDFDMSACFLWILRNVLDQLSKLGSIDVVADKVYKEVYLDSEECRFKTDKFINDIISFASSYENGKFSLLAQYAVIPNQLNKFMGYNDEIFNDVYDKERYEECERNNRRIPEDLKTYLEDLGGNCKTNLLHHGVTVKLKDSRDMNWICAEIDKLILNNQETDNLKIQQTIREVDRWLQQKIKTDEERENLFRGFYPKRHKVVYQTFSLQERISLDEIAKSGQSADLAQLIKNGATVDTVKQLVGLSKEVNLNDALSILKQHPNLTNERIEQLMRLEELSKGWNTEVQYDPSEEQIRLNFENGWKGEAFVFKELQKKGAKVQWPNKSTTNTGNIIIDYEGEEHFIEDRQHKYDLIIDGENGHTSFVQVKATVSDIDRADQIALPISTREWKFINETTETEAYYLARVFNVNGVPEVYYMKLQNAKAI